MKLFVALALFAGLSACSQPSPVLPTGPTESFVHTRQALQRGQKTNGATVAKPAIYEYRYDVTCLADGSEAAKARFLRAKTLMDQRLEKVQSAAIGPQYKRSFEQREANDLILSSTGCQVVQTSYSIVTTAPGEILSWAVKNGVLGEAMGKS